MADFQINNFITAFLTMAFFFVASTSSSPDLKNDLSRIKRSILTFPPNSLVQVTVGLSLAGTIKSDGLGIVLGVQQNAKLPTDTQPFLFPDVLLAKHFSIYDHLKDLISRHGFDGLECLKKMVCEIATIPFTGGILEEVINFVLSPSKHGNIQAKGNNLSGVNNSDVFFLLESERLGKLGENCSTLYQNCVQSPVDLVSHFIIN